MTLINELAQITRTHLLLHEMSNLVATLSIGSAANLVLRESSVARSLSAQVTLFSSNTPLQRIVTNDCVMAKYCLFYPSTQTDRLTVGMDMFGKPCKSRIDFRERTKQNI